MRRIGILGGMGPQATVLLMQKVIDATAASDDGDHIPLIVDQNPQVPSRIRHLIDGTGEDPGPVLAAMAMRLQTAGAEALVMPCNTAHHYASAIRGAATIPFIDMVALSVARAARLAGPDGTVGILASPAVQRIGLFDRAFAATGLNVAYPLDADGLLEAIREIKSKGATSAARKPLIAASAELLSRGAPVQMIACTEFSLMPESVAPGVIVFDTLDLLVEGLIAFATSDSINTHTAKGQPPEKSANVQDPNPNKETRP